MGRKTNLQKGNGNGKGNGGSRGTPPRHYGKTPRGREPSGKNINTSKWGKETQQENKTPSFADQLSQMTGGKPVEVQVEQKSDSSIVTKILPVSVPVILEKPVEIFATAPAPTAPIVPQKTREQKFAEKAMNLICERYGNKGFPVHLSYQTSGRKKIASALLSAYEVISGIKLNYFPDENLSAIMQSWFSGEQGVLKTMASAFKTLEEEILQEALLETFLENLPDSEKFHDRVIVGAIFRTFKKLGIRLIVTKIPPEIMDDIRRVVNFGHIDTLGLSVALEKIWSTYAVKEVDRPEIVSTITTRPTVSA
ncbi:MAG: hypothetical protein Q8O39_00430 [bacterium]|nr:hypothetical protein [bacterium]